MAYLQALFIVQVCPYLALTTWRLMVGEILLDSQKWKLVLCPRDLVPNISAE